MRCVVLIGFLLLLGSPVRAEIIVMIVNPDLERCDYVAERYDDNSTIRSYIDLRVAGFLSGMNVQRQMSGLPILDFGKVMPWGPGRHTIIACQEDGSQAVHDVMLKLYQRYLKEQTGE